VAERIGREARRHHFRARVLAMDDFDRVRLHTLCTRGDVQDRHRKSSLMSR
jgi:hypothetical protein